MASPAQSLLLPFGWESRFEVQERIGSGAMGHVWRAVQVADGRVVALKLLDPSRCGDEQTLARLEIEGQTLMRLRKEGEHEHVVPIVDFKITDAHACLVMEFIPGLNLKKWCSTHNLGLQDRVRLIAQVARAAGWFHGLGVIHRDLKPANILVSAITHQPVIVDFSIAKVEDTLTLTLTNEALGTAPYMAPEQFDRRRGDISSATDVYALGATLYELLTQVHPHPGEFMVVIQRHTEEIRPARPSALNPAVPKDLDSILLKALSHRPEDRYVDGIALANDLDRFLAGRPVAARPISRLTHLARTIRRKPALSAALVACLVLGAFSAWNVRHRLVERQLFTLEARVTAAMQSPVWLPHELVKAEADLDALALLDAAKADRVRGRLIKDVAADVAAVLQRAHLKKADLAWLDDAIRWLQPQAPSEAGRLQSLLQDRTNRWEVLAELHPPFAETRGFFPGSVLRQEQGMLFPPIKEGSTSAQTIVVQERITLPLEMKTIFQVNPATFESIALGVTLGIPSTVAVLCRTSKATPQVLAAVASTAAVSPDGFLLLISHNKVLQKIIPIPDASLLEKDLRLTLTVEPKRAEMVINERWSLMVDLDFGLSSTASSNKCHIGWPPGAGLKDLMLSIRPQDSASPLERADLLVLQSRWPEARRLYDTVQGDPEYGAEARYKVAHCLRRMGEEVPAMELWSRLCQEPPGPWHDRAAYQLWAHTAFKHGLPTAAPLVAGLPKSVSRSVIREFGSGMHEWLVDTYVKEGMSVGLLHVDPQRISNAVRVCRILQISAAQLANRFALACHFARLDQEWDGMLKAALANPAACQASPEELLAGTNCLDQWCRLTLSERNPDLVAAMKLWQHQLPKDPTVGCIGSMEQARRAARSADFPPAATHAEAACQRAGADDRKLVSARLLEGMIHRMRGVEPQAQESWNKALQMADTVALKSPMFLCDRVLLHSLTQTWTLQNATEVLLPLITKHLKGSARASLQTQMLSTFLAQPAFIASLNEVLQDERGRRLVEGHALCQILPREVIHRYYVLMFERWFLRTLDAASLPPAQIARVQNAASLLVTEMAMNDRAESTDLFDFVRAWADPVVAREVLAKDHPYTPALVDELKWLLTRRYSWLP